MIGVLTQPLTDEMKALNPEALKDKTSFIQWSYISILESAGARTVPVIYDGGDCEISTKLPYLNGVFFCGGDGSDDYFAFG